MPRSSNLTSIELQKLAIGQIDLAAGYPNLELPSWIEQVYNNQSGQQYSQEFVWQVGKLRDIDDSLTSAVLRLLALNDQIAGNVCVLPNGSTAINRVVASMALTGGQIVVSSPSFDVIAATVSEFHNCSLNIVNALDIHEFDVELIIDAIDSECVGVILCSPENPTGAVLSEQDIFRITERAAKFGATVFIDHCFCFCSEDGDTVPLIANSAHPDSSWIMLWDTGKTFGLAQEKLAFLISSSDLFPILVDRVRVLCFDTPLRTKRLFLEIFRDTRITSYLTEFQTTISKNRGALRTKIDAKHVMCHLPQTTSLALIKLCNETYRDLENKVHMVPLNVFFAMNDDFSSMHVNWYRVALARDHSEFLRAVNDINEAISRHVPYT